MSKNNNCKKIIEEYLIAHGFDGLFNSADCACKLDDLFPCSESFSECEPGYLHNASYDYEGFRICRTKEAEKEERE